ncbi:MAG: MarR family transcriptional regulator [Amycolatopsis sp.]|jgi:DNA-binding MarR family transcriptional regulator|uniref:MarR family winged helix-turn-helix transcriptional regulator n=1 Tax=Amycolatopsis sp. TaxID=37632 RepID=UPI00261CFF44|nr:MarR family transcriptional regulator [Amycolatopsis sp.]MCU1681709.1 MarR family transcriptional regulator [Amycolatopsis sp.]
MTSEELSLDHNIGFLLRQAHQRAAAAFANALEPHEISGRHYPVLHTLGKRGPLSQRELVDSVNSDKASMVRIVDDLEAKGLAARRPAPGDRRVRSVELTEHGREVLAKAEQTAVDVAESLLTHLDQRKRAQLTALLLDFLHAP